MNTLEAVPKGYRDIYELVADSKFEDPEIVAGSGDSTQSVTKTGEDRAELTINGDGSVGSNEFGVKVDGRVGDGVVPIVTDFAYDVSIPDATGFTSFTRVRREKIPDAPPVPE